MQDIKDLIEEWLTWPVRAVLWGGGGRRGHFLLGFFEEMALKGDRDTNFFRNPKGG